MKVGVVLKNSDTEKYGNTHSIRKLICHWIYDGDECLARRNWVVVSKVIKFLNKVKETYDKEGFIYYYENYCTKEGE